MPKNNIDEQLLGVAGFIFERANGNELGAHKLAEIQRSGFSDTRVDDLEKLLIRFVKDHPGSSDPRLATAVAALGKRFKKDLKPIFIAVLRKTMETDSATMFQAMIALDNLDEKIFVGSASINEVKINHEFAKTYLAKQA